MHRPTSPNYARPTSKQFFFEKKEPKNFCDGQGSLRY
jgi:hypothetical protein